MSFVDPFGSVPFGGLALGQPDDSAPSPVTRLLDGELAQVEHLLWVRPWNPVDQERISLYVSTGGFASYPGDSFPTGEALANTLFLELMSAPPNRETNVLQDGRLSDAAVPSYGEIQLADPNREFRDWLGYQWDGAPYNLYAGSPEWELNSFAPVGMGDLVRMVPNSTAMTLHLRDIIYRLQRDIETRTFLGFGACLHFDGVNDRVTFGDVLDQTGSFTLQCRIWPDTGTQSTSRLWQKSDGSTGWVSYINNLNVGFVIRGSGTLDTTTSPLVLGQWNDVFVIWDQAAMRASVVVNGVEAGVSLAFTSGPAVNAHNLVFGAQNDGTFAYDGKADELAIWSKALTMAETEAYRTKALIGDEANLAGVWHLDEATGTVAFDGNAAANNGTITGALWSGSLTGGSAVAGKRIPRGWGKTLRQWPLTLVDEPDQVYLVMGNPVVAITAFRDQGAESYVRDSDQADPYAATPAAGHWFAVLSYSGSSYIRLGSAPAGQPTVDVEATADHAATEIAVAIAQEAGIDLADIDEGAALGLAASRPGPVHVGSLYDPISADQLVINALSSVKAYRTTGLDGKLTFGLRQLPTSPVAELTDADIDLDGVERLSTLPSARAITVQYRRYWTVQSADSLAGSLTTREKEDLGLEFRSYTTPDDADVLAANPSAESEVLTTYLDSDADARDEADRDALIRATPTHTDRIPLLRERHDLQPGQVIRITASVLDYDSGRVVFIAGKSADDSSRRHSLMVWGPTPFTESFELLWSDANSSDKIEVDSGDGSTLTAM